MNDVQSLAHTKVVEYNRRTRLAKLALDGATSPDCTPEHQLDFFCRALALWPQGSYERNLIESQHPELMAQLEAKRLMKNLLEA